MKKKIAVFTLQGLVNYGNRLQNYAVEYLLKDLGFQPYSIIVTNYPVLKPIQRELKRLKMLLSRDRRKVTEAKRQELFSEFNKKLNVVYYNYNKLRNIDKKFMYCLVGSDQVWNPEFNTDNIFLLSFSNNRICLSPSFGVADIESINREKYKEALLKFDKLSVREESGVRLINDIVGRSAELLVDPTMAIDRSVWESLEKKPKNFNIEEYIFSYTLGDLTEKRKNIIDSLQKKYGWKHVEIFDDLKENKYIVGPSEFLWLIHHAKFIITDSFHASVFSVLFEKHFLVIPRVGGKMTMYGRIETLLKKCGLEACDLEHFDINSLGITDYVFCRNQIEIEKKKVVDYLKSVLNV